MTCIVGLQIPAADVARVDTVLAVARRERRDARAIGVAAERASQRSERPLSDAAAADETPIGVRRDDGEVRFPPAERTVPVGPPRQIDALHQHFRRSRQERPQRQHQDLIEAGRRACRRALLSVGPLCARGGGIPGGDERLERVPAARERKNRVVLGGFERVEAPQNVGGLAERQPEIGPFERDVAEPHQRPAGRLLRPQPLRVGLNPRQRNARLHAALHLDQGDLHVDRRSKLGLPGFELLELDNLARLGARGTRRAVGHRAIVSRDRGRGTCGSGRADRIERTPRHAADAFRPDHWLRGGAVREDRRPRRRARRAALGAGASRVGRHPRAATLSRRHGRRADRSRAGHRRWLHARGRIFRRAARRRGACAADRLPRPVRSRRALRHRQRRLSRQPAAVRDARARRARVRGTPRRGTVDRARARLASRLGARLPQDPVRDTSSHRRHAGGVHDSQSRVPGTLRARLAAAARFAVGTSDDRAAGILGPHQLSQGRHHRRRHRHDREPEVRRGNPDARTRLRLRRHPAASHRPSGRNPQRNRYDRVGSRARSVSAGVLRRARPGGEGRDQESSARTLWPANRRANDGASAGGDDFADGRSERLRPPGVDRRRPPAARRDVHRPRHRRGPL